VVLRRGRSRPQAGALEAAFAIFFVISGFLLYRPFVRARVLDREPLSSRAYGWRRFLRIVPAFWVALTVVAVVVGPGLSGWGEAVRNYGFLQLYYGAGVHDVIPQAWTLCVEVLFYASLPLWAGLMRRLPGHDLESRLRVELIACAALIAGSLAYISVLVYTHAVDQITFAPAAALSSLPAYMDHIGLGMLLAVASVWAEEGRPGRLPRPVELLARFPIAGWVVAAGAVAGGGALLGLHTVYTPTEYVARHLLNSVVAVAVVIPAVFGDPRQGLVRRVLGSPVLVYLGLISYGFYLYHWAVLRQVYEWDLDGTFHVTSSFAWFGLGLAGALVLGSLSYYLVERPALSLKRLVPPRPRQEALAEPAPAAPVTAPPAA